MLNIGPADRLTVLNDAPVRGGGDYVLYWMVAQRRSRHNWALELALAEARRLDRPLVVLEALRVDYPWASDRIHSFVIEGMAETSRAFEAAGIRHLAYLEPEPGAGKGLLAALAARASLVVTDDFPVFFLPRMLAAAARDLDLRLIAVDGNGLLPIHEPRQPFATAHAFRRYYQKNLRGHLALAPLAEPLEHRAGPREQPDLDRLIAPWPLRSATDLDDPAAIVARLPIDHSVPAVAARGGMRAAAAKLDR
ncbi:MAG: deoxyribodipyrimidine photolyase, partial [Myxococcales bacterium]|nr:deoxyribodipyrimidine photolyase [Myxococcales bacterium]